MAGRYPNDDTIVSAFAVGRVFLKTNRQAVSDCLLNKETTSFDLWPRRFFHHGEKKESWITDGGNARTSYGAMAGNFIRTDGLCSKPKRFAFTLWEEYVRKYHVPLPDYAENGWYFAPADRGRSFWNTGNQVDPLLNQLRPTHSEASLQEDIEQEQFRCGYEFDAY